MTALVSASKNRQKASLLNLFDKSEFICDISTEMNTHPPIPQWLGSVTFSAAEVATAASATGDVSWMDRYISWKA